MHEQQAETKGGSMETNAGEAETNGEKQTNGEDSETTNEAKEKPNGEPNGYQSDKSHSSNQKTVSEAECSYSNPETKCETETKYSETNGDTKIPYVESKLSNGCTSVDETELFLNGTSCINGKVHRRTDSTKSDSPRHNGRLSKWSCHISLPDDDDDKAKKNRSRHASSSSSSASSSSAPSVRAPDGGWGWVVVFASFLCHLIADGCAFSFGVLYVELLDYFGESKGKTAWVGSLFVSVPLMTGPIASAVTNRYGCRVTTIAGSIIATIGFIWSSQVNSIEMLCVTFGLIAGFGLGMVYVPAVIIVAYYFEKRRAFATGIAVAGSGIGTFVFAPLTEFLIDVYGWRGALLIIGGLMLNISVCGTVFRPLVSPKLERRRRRYQARMERFSRICTRHEVNQQQIINKSYMDDLMNAPVTQSVLQFPTYLKQEITVLYPSLLEKENEDKTLHEVLAENDLLDKFSQSLTDIPNQQQQEAKAVISNSSDRQVVWNKLNTKKPVPPSSSYIQPLQRKDIFYRGSLAKGPVKSSHSCPNIHVHYEEEEDDDWWIHWFRFSRGVKHILGEMMDLSILRSVVFLFICFSTFLLYFSYDVPYVFTPDYAMEIGIAGERASFLVSIIGITSTIGQILIGYVGDLPGVNVTVLYSLLTAVAGAVTVLVPWYTTYGALAAFAAAYGFFISANYTLTTILLVNLLGMDKLTNAYGIEMLAEGTANLIGPPLSGWLTDYTHSYDLTFIINGLVIMVSGLMLLATPCLYRCDPYVPARNIQPIDDEDDDDPPSDIVINTESSI